MASQRPHGGHAPDMGSLCKAHGGAGKQCGPPGGKDEEPADNTSKAEECKGEHSQVKVRGER